MVWDRIRLVRQRWLSIMMVSALAIVFNALLVVVPAVRSATTIALQTVSAGRLPAGYARAYITESVAGGINIVPSLLAVASGMFRFGTKGSVPVETKMTNI